MNACAIFGRGLVTAGCAAFLHCLLACPGRADILLDTGELVSQNYGTHDFGPATNEGQHWAGEFTISQPWRITGVAVSVYLYDPQREWDGESFDLRIYESAGNVPAGATDVDADTFRTALVTPTAHGWWGEQSLAWDLAPGTYWLGIIAYGGSFQTRQPDTPLGAYAGIYGGQEWMPGSSEMFAARIEGVIIPEPSSLLLTIAAAGILLWRRLR